MLMFLPLPNPYTHDDAVRYITEVAMAGRVGRFRYRLRADRAWIRRASWAQPACEHPDAH